MRVLGFDTLNFEMGCATVNKAFFGHMPRQLNQSQIWSFLRRLDCLAKQVASTTHKRRRNRLPPLPLFLNGNAKIE